MSKKKFLVERKEVTKYWVVVEAKDMEEAKDIIYGSAFSSHDGLEWDEWMSERCNADADDFSSEDEILREISEDEAKRFDDRDDIFVVSYEEDDADEFGNNGFDNENPDA